ncbi:hypothetical protein AVEN_174962-1, partial [Araneus ventricosus]
MQPRRPPQQPMAGLAMLLYWLPPTPRCLWSGRRSVLIGIAATASTLPQT